MGGVERLMGMRIAVCVMYEMNKVQREQFVWLMVGGPLRAIIEWVY